MHLHPAPPQPHPISSVASTMRSRSRDAFASHPISCVASTMRSRSRDAFASHPTPTPPHQLRSIDHAVKIKRCICIPDHPNPTPSVAWHRPCGQVQDAATPTPPHQLRSIDHAVKIKRCICIPPPQPHPISCVASTMRSSSRCGNPNPTPSVA